jgi:N-acetylneuraminic acid mutarotase
LADAKIFLNLFRYQRMKFFLSLLLCAVSFSFYSQDWAEVAPVPADGRDDAVAFSLGGRGYLVTGNQGGFSESNRLWEYAPESGSWTEKAPFPGEARQYAGAFVIGNNAYVIMGISPGNVPLNDVWKYNAANNEWTQLHDFPGDARWSMFAFATPNAGYIGTGSTLTALLNDTWKYNPLMDSWSREPDFPGGTLRETVSFSIGEKGYTGLGYATLGGSNFSNNMYEWNELSGSWIQLADFPGVARSYANAVGTNAFGYVGTGQDGLNGFHTDCFRLDPVSREWSPVSAIPVSGIKGMSAFAIEDTPYFLTGITDNFTRVSTVWKLTNAPGTAGNLFSYYPNPSNGALVVKVINGSLVQLFTTDGKCYYEAYVDHQQTLFVEDLPAGSYQLKVQTGERVFVGMLIVH